MGGASALPQSGRSGAPLRALPRLRACLLVLGGSGLGCTATGESVVQPHHTAVQVGVDRASENSLARDVWGLEPTDVMPALDPEVMAESGQEPQSAGQEPETRDGATLRARFGSSIVIAGDGTVTKQYFLSGETGKVFLNLLREPSELAQKPEQRQLPKAPIRFGGGARSESILAQMIGDQEIELFYIQDFEKPEGVTLRNDPAAKPQPPVFTGEPPPLQAAEPNSLLLVSAQPDALAAFEGALNLFFGSIPQIEIEIKVVEYSTSNTLAFGVRTLDSTTPTLTQLSSGKLIGDIISQFPLAAPSVTGTEFSDRGIITLGGIHDTWRLNAQLEMLEAEGVADILTSPRLVVRNGGTAQVVTQTDFPYPKARISSSGQNVTANIAFRPVGVLLNIRPVVAGTETVILQLYANISAVTSFADTDPVDTPVISSREVITSVHVADGKTTVIGGLVTRSTLDQTSQVPILGDIPLLGMLFRSTSTITNETTLEFHITPRIVRGSGGFVGE